MAANKNVIIFTAALISALTALATGAYSQGNRFQFGAFGDIPYTAVADQEYRRVLSSFNSMDLAFVIHVGDFQHPKIGTGPCTNENYQRILESFQSVRH